MLCLIPLALWAALAALRLSSVLRGRSRRRNALAPLVRWYFRLFRLRVWLLLYLVVLHVRISTLIPPRTRMLVTLLYAAFSVGAWLSVVNHWENALREKWRVSILAGRNRHLLAPSLLIHTLLTVLPLLGCRLIR